VYRPKKLLYSSTDENFKPAVHELYDSSHKIDKICRYDLDELDTTWLTQYNKLRQQSGLYRVLYCIFTSRVENQTPSVVKTFGIQWIIIIIIVVVINNK